MKREIKYSVYFLIFICSRSFSLQSQTAYTNLAEQLIEDFRFYEAVYVLSQEQTSNHDVKYNMLLCKGYFYASEFNKCINLSSTMMRSEELKESAIHYFKLYYALCHQKLEKCDVAQPIFELLIKNADQEIAKEADKGIKQCSNFVQESVKKDLKITTLPSPINTKDHELLPTSADEGNILGWTRVLQNISKNVHKDIFIASKLNSEIYKVLNTVTINNNALEELNYFSEDGRSFMYTSIEEKEMDYIYYKGKLLNNFTASPQVQKFKGLEKYAFTGYTLNRKGDIIYFSANSKQEGKKDLYSSFLTSDTTWATPVNLGLHINSEDNEVYPFLHPNEQVIYFASDRKESYGGFDIFRSRLENGQWQKPEKLEYPINSIADEIGFSVTPNSKIGFISSNRQGGTGGFDIYKIDLPKENIPLTLIKGKVITKDGSVPDKVWIKIYDKETNNELKYVYNPNPQNGKYLMIFPPGKNYDMVIEAEGYASYTFNIHVPEQSYYYQLQQTIYLHPEDKANKGIEVKNLFDDNIQIRDKDESAREEKLLQLIEKIIIESDTSALKNLDEYISTSGSLDTKYYTTLVDIVGKVIESGDLKMMENLELITEDEPYIEPELKIFFGTNSSELSDIDKDNIKIFCAKISPYAKIELSGHSDNTGTSLSKYMISMLRVNIISDFLQKECQLEEQNFIITAKSDAIPLGDPNTIEGSKLNRRVEIRIIK